MLESLFNLLVCLPERSPCTELAVKISFVKLRIESESIFVVCKHLTAL